MSTTVTYKGSTIATVESQTKTLTTAGKWMEGDITLTDKIPLNTIFDGTVSGSNRLSLAGTLPAIGDIAVTITFDNVEYECIRFSDGGVPTYGAPYEDYSEYPFCIWYEGGYWSYSIDDNNSHTLKIQVPSNAFVLQSESVQPTEAEQTITPDYNGFNGLSSVTTYAISSTYVGSGIARNDSSDLTASGATVTAAAGYYSTDASKTIASGSATTPATTITANPTISVDSAGLITATTSTYKNITPTISAGYVSSGTAGKVTVSGSNTSQLSTQAAKTVTPTTSSQTAVAAGKYTTGAVTVGAIQTETLTLSDFASSHDYYPTSGKYFSRVSTAAISTQTKNATPSESAQTITPDSGKYLSAVNVGAISSTYVGSDILPRSGEDVTISNSGAITIPEGYYNQDNTRQLSTEAAKTVTPTTSSQTAVAAKKYTTGAITVAAIPSQYIVPSGTVYITANGTTDVTNYASAVANVSIGESWLPTSASLVASASETINLSSDTTFDSWTPTTTNTNILSSGSTRAACSYTIGASEYQDKALIAGALIHVDIKYVSGATMGKGYSLHKVLYTLGLYSPWEIPDFDNIYYAMPTSITLARQVYYSSATSIQLYNAGSYGLGPTAAAAFTSSSSTSTTSRIIGFTRPAIYARCHSSYFSTDAAANVDSANTNIYFTYKIWLINKTDSLLYKLFDATNGVVFR